MKLLAATHNPGKLKELRRLLPGIEFTTLTEEGIIEEAVEDGSTFLENAIKKCLFYSRRTDFFVVAEDSGICVEYLDGEPGVMSARYAGEGSTVQQCNELVLDKLKGVPSEKRGAFFMAVCVAGFRGRILAISYGKVCGQIAFEARGTGGFGYDPLFLLPDIGKTTAEISPEEKDRISHRSKAIRGLKHTLKLLLSGSAA